MLTNGTFCFCLCHGHDHCWRAWCGAPQAPGACSAQHDPHAFRCGGSLRLTRGELPRGGTGHRVRRRDRRALSLRPKLLLCDEPTGNLDSKNSNKVVQLLKDLASEFGATLMVVTHDEKVAAQFQRKIVIEDGQIIS